MTGGFGSEESLPKDFEPYLPPLVSFEGDCYRCDERLCEGGRYAALNDCDILKPAMMHVVLYQPEIPPNTGNIARQCVGMDSCLHLIKPIGFDLSKSAVRRAGLDYWDELKLTVHESPDAFLGWLGKREPWLVTRYGSLRYDKPDYRKEEVLIFGSETKGLPQNWLERWPERTLYVPILGKIRNYNLSNTVSVVLAHAILKAGIYG